MLFASMLWDLASPFKLLEFVGNGTYEQRFLIPDREEEEMRACEGKQHGGTKVSGEGAEMHQVMLICFNSLPPFILFLVCMWFLSSYLFLFFLNFFNCLGLSGCKGKKKIKIHMTENLCVFKDPTAPLLFF